MEGGGFPEQPLKQLPASPLPPEFAEPYRRVKAEMLIERRLKAEHMARIITELDIKPGSRVLELEPCDPVFTLTLALSGVDVTAVSEMFEKVGENGRRRRPHEADKPNVLTNLELLYDEHIGDVGEADGRLGFAHSVLEADLNDNSLDAAILTNRMDVMEEKDASETVIKVLHALKSGGRMLVSPADPGNRDSLLRLLENGTPPNTELKEVARRVPTDAYFHRPRLLDRNGYNGVVYEVVKHA